MSDYTRLGSTLLVDLHLMSSQMIDRRSLPFGSFDASPCSKCPSSVYALRKDLEHPQEQAKEEGQGQGHFGRLGLEMLLACYCRAVILSGADYSFGAEIHARNLLVPAEAQHYHDSLCLVNKKREKGPQSTRKVKQTRLLISRLETGDWRLETGSGKSWLRGEAEQCWCRAYPLSNKECVHLDFLLGN